MNAQTHPAAHHYSLQFKSLCGWRHDLAFPCDGQGHVDIDELSDRTRNDYLFARALIGKDFERPAVQVND
jgi:hypothetical protein